MDHGTFVTLLYAVVDTTRNTCTVARAGHELPLLLRANDPTHASGEFLGSEGMPLGLVPDDVFAGVIRDYTASFRENDVLVMYTDGLTEAPNSEGKEFAGSRLADAVRAFKGRSPKEINDAVMESVLRFSGQPTFRDDLTLVTLKRV
jgi:sigma-B regulation protein RsbU (phosphoserine phosphatase)